MLPYRFLLQCVLRSTHKIVDIESSHARLTTAQRSAYALYNRHFMKILCIRNVGVHINIGYIVKIIICQRLVRLIMCYIYC